MSKGSNEALTVLELFTHVAHVDQYGVVTQDGLPLTVLISITVLNIQRIYVQSAKSFGAKLGETFPTIPFGSMLCMSKGSKVISTFDMLQLDIALGGMVGKVSVPAFQNFLWIEQSVEYRRQL